MIDSLAKNLVGLKKEFHRMYNGKSQVQEAVVKSSSEQFPIDNSHLELLHRFAAENPIYSNSFEQTIGGVNCIVYEGDTNRYWLNSIQHVSSKAPFSPTWIMSAYIVSLFAKESGYSKVVDIGSGDGRIAFCSGVLGMDSYSIEIDETLVDLQKSMSLPIDFHPCCSDAAGFDYSSLGLSRPMFFVGGLAQMGGTSLASAVLDVIAVDRKLYQNSGWAFVGTLSKKYTTDPKGGAGWGTLIDGACLKIVKSILLPAAWTFHELDEAVYIFAQWGNRNPH